MRAPRTRFYDHDRGFMRISSGDDCQCELGVTGRMSVGYHENHFDRLDFNYDDLLDYAEMHAELGEETAMEEHPSVVRHLSDECSYCWEILEEHIQDYARKRFTSS